MIITLQFEDTPPKGYQLLEPEEFIKPIRNHYAIYNPSLLEWIQVDEIPLLADRRQCDSPFTYAKRKYNEQR